MPDRPGIHTQAEADAPRQTEKPTVIDKYKSLSFLFFLYHVMLTMNYYKKVFRYFLPSQLGLNASSMITNLVALYFYIRIRKHQLKYMYI